VHVSAQPLRIAPIVDDDGRPPMPPDDLPERLREAAKDAEYLVRRDRRLNDLAQLWHDRYVAMKAAVDDVLNAADKGQDMRPSIGRLRDSVGRPRGRSLL
jgi:hypothetical protein